jgi:hypothetical protein
VAALNSVQVGCPTCGETITIPLEAVFGEAESNRLPVTLTPDLAPITIHAATHQEA